MMNLQSDTVTVAKPSATIVAFLSDLSNLQQLMPEDRISDWEASETHCQFQIKGLSRISFGLDRSEANGVYMVSQGKNPFPFQLNILVAPNDEGSCSVKIEFNGEANAFLKMMVEKPLTNFLNMLTAKLQEVQG
ncbi:MAG: hypothetical protein ACFB10_12225 [Salibacteraceae bacterium]